MKRTNNPGCQKFKFPKFASSNLSMSNKNLQIREYIKRENARTKTSQNESVTWEKKKRKTK